MNETILTYGAGGVQGAPVAHDLLRRGVRVRALVTDLNKNAGLRQAGAELVQGDLADLDSVRRATVGADRVFLTLPFSGRGDPLTYARHALQAAQEAGVRLLVLNTSGQTPEQETGLPMLDYRLRLEAMLRESGVPGIILRPTAYLENLLGPWVLPRLRAEGVLAYPVEAERAVSWIAAADLGRFAAAALGRPDLAGQAFNLGGPEALRGADLAGALTRALGREVRYEPISPEAFGAMLGRVMGPEAEAGIVAAYRAGAAAPPDAMVVDMARVLEQLPVTQLSAEAWARQHAGALGSEAAPDQDRA